ncbi:hypothetical protein [Pedobacter miscanthi]|jgi:hypothetical protein|uniref:hypothetical protein n=1 Tax=Pedobacter miscanthi TaxID=2259170 RepID=UPI002930E5B7|nr:hypothetical protein [Pedobacter miscanthi]
MNNIDKLLKQLCTNILEYLNDRDLPNDRGITAPLLFLLAFYEQSDDDKLAIVCQQLMDEMVERAAKTVDFTPQNIRNVISSAWLFQSLQDREVIPATETFFLDFTDNYLSVASDYLAAQEKFTHDNGLTAIGHYWLKRKNITAIQKTIQLLKMKVQTVENGTGWPTFSSEDYRFILDMGYSHGNMGIIEFLARCRDYKIETITCTSLISGYIALLANSAERQYNHQDQTGYDTYQLKYTGSDNLVYTNSSLWPLISETQVAATLLPIINLALNFDKNGQSETLNLAEQLKMYFMLEGSHHSFSREALSARDRCAANIIIALKKNTSNICGLTPGYGNGIVGLPGIGLVLMAAQKNDKRLQSLFGFELPTWITNYL